MKPWMPFQIQSVTSWEDLRRVTDQGFQNLYKLMNGNVQFQDNINCQIVEVIVSTATITIDHNFGRIPYGFLVLNQNANANIWSASFAWTSSSIYLTASATVTAKIAILGG